jgi:hypothetical protein
MTQTYFEWLSQASPDVQLQLLVSGHWIAQAIAVVAELGIAVFWRMALDRVTIWHKRRVVSPAHSTVFYERWRAWEFLPRSNRRGLHSRRWQKRSAPTHRLHFVTGRCMPAVTRSGALGASWVIASGQGSHPSSTSMGWTTDSIVHNILLPLRFSMPA